MMDIENKQNLKNLIKLLESDASINSLIDFITSKDYIKIDLKESFKDTETKEIVNVFKTLLKELDDATFLEVAEKAGAAIHMKRFDELLNKEKYSEAEAIEVESFIDYFSQLIYSSLQNKINNLPDLF